MHKSQIQNLAGQALDWILPPRCIVSGVPVDVQGMVAPHIWAQLNFIADPMCKTCGLPYEYELGGGMLCGECLKNPPSYSSARSALRYDDISRDMILSFKHGDQAHAVKAFIPWLIKAGGKLISQADVIIPVPLHRWRLLRRRYNQAALIAWALSKETEKPHIPDLLTRTRSTVTQGHLKAHQRAKNVKNAFALDPKHEGVWVGKTALLIDDVYTTGATVNECAKALMKGGFESVNVLTVARVVKS